MLHEDGNENGRLEDWKIWIKELVGTVPVR
jgi:hypothetical protein